jgi:hypothetical protein
MAMYKRTPLVYTMGLCGDGLGRPGLAVASDICDGELIVEEVVVRLQDKPDRLVAVVKGKSQVEARSGVDLVRRSADDGLVYERDIADGITLERVAWLSGGSGRSVVEPDCFPLVSDGKPT